MKNLKNKQFAILALCLFFLSACTTHKNASEETGTVRWPDFLRNWAADCEINDSQRLSLINLIDSVYYFLEDSTQSVEAHSDQVCRMLDQMAEVIANDSAFEFTRMMRATASNFLQQAIKDDRIYQFDCFGESINGFLLWQTKCSTEGEGMYFTIMPPSWQAPLRSANIVFTMEKGAEEPLAIIVITDYENFQMDSIQIAFYDSTNTILEVVHENDVYVDSSKMYKGIKTMVMPYQYMMLALSQYNSVYVTYKTAKGRSSMTSHPGVFFEKQITNCPRLKEVLDQLKQ